MACIASWMLAPASCPPHICALCLQLWNAAELHELHCEFPVALEHGLEVGALSGSLQALHLVNCWTVWRLGGGQRSVEGRMERLRSLTLDSVCKSPLP